MFIRFNMTFFQATFAAGYFQDLPGLITKDLGSNLFSLGIYLTGMVLYAIIIWHFYQFMAKRELFKMKIERPARGFSYFIKKIFDFFEFILHYVFIFPVISFIWFLVLSGFLMFLSKSNDMGQIFLISITVIATARITAYYNEDLSKDISKLVPFALLGVFIVDPTYFSMDATMAKFFSLPDFFHVILQYLIALVMMEFLLRVLYGIKIWMFAEKKQAD